MDMVLKNITLVDGRGGEPIADAAIGIDGTRIGYVGPASDAPRSAKIEINGKSATALPGLINAHTHITLDAYLTGTSRPYNSDGEKRIWGCYRQHRADIGRCTTGSRRCGTAMRPGPERLPSRLPSLNACSAAGAQFARPEAICTPSRSRRTGLTR